MMSGNISYNMFTERVENFNRNNDRQLMTEYFNENVQGREIKDIEWETYSVSEIQTILSLSEDEARKLLKSGLFKVHRVGNEYRASKKSVEENKNIVIAMTTYQGKKTMTVRDMSRILGLGKTASYRLIGQNLFKKFLVFGKIRIDVESFEEWYASQFHYKKVNGERPGKNHDKTVTPLTVAKVLGIPRSTANDLMNNGIVDFIWVDGHRHISRESFEKWYASQNKFKKVMEIEEVEDYVD